MVQGTPTGFTSTTTRGGFAALPYEIRMMIFRINTKRAFKALTERVEDMIDLLDIYDPNCIVYDEECGITKARFLGSKMIIYHSYVEPSWGWGESAKWGYWLDNLPFGKEKFDRDVGDYVSYDGVEWEDRYS